MNEIKRTQQRARAYNLSDGIAEIVAGGALVLIGCVSLAANRVDSDTLRYLSLVNMFALALLSWWIVRMLKERITYPRTGYIRSPKPRLSYGLRFALNFAICMITVTLLDKFKGDTRFGQAFFLVWILMISVPMAVLAIRSRIPRFLIIATVTVATALIVTFGGVPETERIAFVMAIPGATAVVTGTYALKSYLKLHPKPDEDAEL